MSDQQDSNQTIFKQTIKSPDGSFEKVIQEKTEELKIQDNPQPTDQNLDLDVLTDLVQEYLHAYDEALDFERRKSLTPIEVDELASKLARLYEKVRRIIDWKEENLVRRTSIERILKRRLFSEYSNIRLAGELNPSEMSEPMVLELIRSGYFPNGKIAKEKIFLVEKVLEKYIFIIKSNSSGGTQNKKTLKEKVAFFNWVIELAACEIESVLDPSLRENALINLMTKMIYKRIKLIPSKVMDVNEVFIQTYIAVHRTLFNLDDPIIIYNLIKLKFPDFFINEADQIHYYAANIKQLQESIDNDLEEKNSSYFFAVCDQYDAAYLLIGDAFKELAKSGSLEKNKIVAKEEFHQAVEKVYQQRYKTLKRRLFRSAIYSTLSIFVTSGVSFIIFEGPVAKMVHGYFSPFALLIDLLIPTILMFILVIIIKLPPASNIFRIKQEVDSIMYKNEDPQVYEIIFNKNNKSIFNAIFAFISLIAGLISMIFIYWVFKVAGVPWTSLYVDTINVAMVVFAAMVIRHRSKEITIAEGGSFIEFFVDLFYIPIAKIGQWFSQKWKEYNFVSVIFTALVDTPFSALIAMIEDWRDFLKKRRSEIH